MQLMAAIYFAFQFRAQRKCGRKVGAFQTQQEGWQQNWKTLVKAEFKPATAEKSEIVSISVCAFSL